MSFKSWRSKPIWFELARSRECFPLGRINPIFLVTKQVSALNISNPIMDCIEMVVYDNSRRQSVLVSVKKLILDHRINLKIYFNAKEVSSFASLSEYSQTYKHFIKFNYFCALSEICTKHAVDRPDGVVTRGLLINAEKCFLSSKLLLFCTNRERLVSMFTHIWTNFQILASFRPLHRDQENYRRIGKQWLYFSRTEIYTKVLTTDYGLRKCTKSVACNYLHGQPDEMIFTHK